jgi:HSP20 family molecular chaperone IbpA
MVVHARLAIFSTHPKVTTASSQPRARDTEKRDQSLRTTKMKEIPAPVQAVIRRVVPAVTSELTEATLLVVLAMPGVRERSIS